MKFIRVEMGLWLCKLSRQFITRCVSCRSIGIAPPMHPICVRALIPISMSRSDSFRGGERTANEVHATLCAMVTTQAASFSAWSAYESVLLDPATAAFFAARLSSEHSDGESNPPSKKKKRKLGDDGSGSDEEADGDPVAVVCEHCGGAVPEVSLRVACLDGTTLDVTVPQRELVREVKRTVGQVRCNVSRIDCLALIRCMQRRSRD